MLDRELSLGNLSSAKASVRGPALTHVMYTDDIVLFSKATRKDAKTLASCLEKYCVWSGQSLSRTKSGIFFSKHTTANYKRTIKQLLQMKSLKKDAVYLGAPLFMSRSPSKDFKRLQEKLESKLSGQRSRSLLWAGRCTLITSVAQAIPSYTLLAFHIPTKNYDKLDSLTKRFWWKPKEKEGKFIAWKQWDKLCRPKFVGGLGFKKTKEVNAVLLAKLAWMVALGKQSICMEVLHTKYKVKDNQLRAEPKKIASPTWRVIEDAKNLIVKGACYLLGDGKSINVWEDPWIPWIEVFKPQPRIEVCSQLPFKAHHLFDSSSKTWDANMINEIFASDSALAILTIPIPIPITTRQDKLIWLPNPK